jgi:hypothetical protein
MCTDIVFWSSLFPGKICISISMKKPILLYNFFFLIFSIFKTFKKINYREPVLVSKIIRMSCLFMNCKRYIWPGSFTYRTFISGRIKKIIIFSKIKRAWGVSFLIRFLLTKVIYWFIIIIIYSFIIIVKFITRSFQLRWRIYCLIWIWLVI